ncbi:merozoite surface protein CMZ-8-like [Haliotis rufescens]|uniref:merozoite surface protein CMZ-8-like n=1 Tax=Haliotis rufescens TaxID=6454 RepID=UPI00201F155B|nr:merozoite surface protein CMZ-8-like [Haliotis rufescens]
MRGEQSTLKVNRETLNRCTKLIQAQSRADNSSLPDVSQEDEYLTVQCTNPYKHCWPLLTHHLTIFPSSPRCNPLVTSPSSPCHLAVTPSSPHVSPSSPRCHPLVTSRLPLTSLSPPRHPMSPPRHLTSPPRHLTSPPRHLTSPPRHLTSPPRHLTSPPHHPMSPPRHLTVTPVNSVGPTQSWHVVAVISSSTTQWCETCDPW